jgi:hypothetical protein
MGYHAFGQVDDGAALLDPVVITAFPDAPVSVAPLVLAALVLLFLFTRGSD